jgi:hypothetical protein
MYIYFVPLPLEMKTRAVKTNISSAYRSFCVLSTLIKPDIIYKYIQGDQKVSVHLMITIQKVASNVQSVPRQYPDMRERDHWEDPGVDGKMILRWIFRKWDMGEWTVLSWLRIDTGTGHL